jgi:hypothetical protein
MPMEDAIADPATDAIDSPHYPHGHHHHAIAGDIAKPNKKMKKELSVAEREVQNQKRQARQVAERARKD